VGANLNACRYFAEMTEIGHYIFTRRLIGLIELFNGVEDPVANHQTSRRILAFFANRFINF
jgi:hypothetical protein